MGEQRDLKRNEDQGEEEDVGGGRREWEGEVEVECEGEKSTWKEEKFVPVKTVGTWGGGPGKGEVSTCAGTELAGMQLDIFPEQYS